MTPSFPIHLSPVNTSLPHFWRTSMRTLSARIILVDILKYADNRTRFPNELLSLEQNKDAPYLTKKLMIWTFGEDPRPHQIDAWVAADPPLPFFFFAETIGPKDPEMSPVLASSHANLPPTFFQICGLDPLRDDGFLYERLLREAGCKTYVKVYV
jgi:acetyl esterase/lipase